MSLSQIFENAALEWLCSNPVYRGQWCSSGALRSDLPTFSFGTRSAAEIYASNPNDQSLMSGIAMSPKIFSAKLAVEKVYCRTSIKDTDPYFDLDMIGEEFGLDVLLSIVSEASPAIEDTGGFADIYDETGLSLIGMVKAWPEHVKQLPPVPAYLALQVPEFVEAVQAAGDDAVAFGGSGETALEMEWHIFDGSKAICAETGLEIGVHTVEDEMQIEF